MSLSRREAFFLRRPAPDIQVGRDRRLHRTRSAARSGSTSPRSTEAMERRRKIRYQACSVEVTSAGLLRFRFRWKTPDGVARRFAEATALRDTRENRRRVERQAELMGAEIRAGAFNYLTWFPNGKLPSTTPPWLSSATSGKNEERFVDGAPLLRRMDRAQNCTSHSRVGGPRLSKPLPQLYSRSARRGCTGGFVASSPRRPAH